MIHLIKGLGVFRVPWSVLWQQLQVFRGGVGHVVGEGGAVPLELIALHVGDVGGPAAA
jgi:hypothetical protein